MHPPLGRPYRRAMVLPMVLLKAFGLAMLGGASAQPHFSNVFQSHMVLQRDEPLVREPPGATPAASLPLH